ncbi:hypothetical protein MEQU1_001390 [Malassezia equina]|uniref:Uncharacterized protein n=1 Tax=Malassezia equina TaxID=1381935 RepID=A0AAF0EDT5_9BASI|nr:hypothetical protein MEQU1_001390 [Malassezia equina]
MAGRGRGRGAYYRAKYGGGGRQRGHDEYFPRDGENVSEKRSRTIRGNQEELAYDEKLQGGGWSGAKGGQIQVDAPVCENIPHMVQQALLYTSHDATRLAQHVHAVEDQASLRHQLPDHELVAFVPNGALLPRASGASDQPLRDCVPFVSPPGLQVTLHLPHRGPITGMGLRRGQVCACLGGGFHGKSTFLAALSLGCYNHVPGDGREFVCTTEQVASIRSEDGRSIQHVDISPFITNLPDQSDTSVFSTSNASGSTSCAASLMEALEAKAELLVLDEDTVASNFLVRDRAMQALVPNEPITPLVARVRSLVDTMGVTLVLVCGSSSAFLPCADTVLQMDCYEMKDVTQKAQELCMTMSMEQWPATSSPFGAPMRRELQLPLPGGKMVTRHRTVIHVGDDALELHAVPQLVHASQTRAIEALLRRWAAASPRSVRLKALIDSVSSEWDQKGMYYLQDKHLDGFLARPRKIDIAMALNRMRHVSWRTI